jgi:hypothetical protein
MSQFSGKQYKGAKRVLKELKREEAEKRQAESRKNRALLDSLVEPLTEVISAEEVAEAVGIVVNANPGPVVPGLVKRNRKVRGVVRNQRKTEE